MINKIIKEFKVKFTEASYEAKTTAIDIIQDYKPKNYRELQGNIINCFTVKEICKVLSNIKWETYYE